MPTITGLSVQKRNRERVSVYLDGSFAFGLAKAVAVELNTGQELNGAQIAELKRRDGYQENRRRALKLIARRPRSVEEIRRYLRDRATPVDMIDSIVDDLVERDLLDDLEFARAWVENRNEFRPRSTYALRSELRQRGVGRQTIDRALEEFDERRAAESAARKAARKFSGDDRRDRMYAYLARRGFPYSTIRSVVEEVLATDGQDESEVVE